MKLETVKGGKSLLIVGLLLVVVLAVTFGVIVNLGRAYRGGISVTPQTQQEEATLVKKKNIRKITLKRAGETSCIEVTPDGAVRVYEACGETLDSAARLADPKNILKLFKIVSEQDLSKYQEGDGEVYQLLIETDSGTQVVTIVIGSSDGGDEIINVIDNIYEDIPNPSINPQSSTAPTSSVAPGSSPYPSPTAGPNYPSPTPSSGGSPDQPFTCGFEEGLPGKPPRVSNTVCTDDPKPGV